MKSYFAKFWKKLSKERGNTFFRKVDRYVGIFLLFFLSFFRKKKSFPKQIKKIGIIKLAGIGDTVLLARSIYALRKKFPKMEIFFFSGKANYEIASLLAVDKVIVLSPFSCKNAVQKLSKENLDVLIDAEPWSRISAIFTYFSKAKFTIGFMSKRQFKHFCFDRIAKHQKNRHELENGFSLFEVFQLEKPLEYDFQTKRENSPEKIVVFHPCPGGSSVEYRKWPKSYWRKLFSYFQDTEYKIYVTGSKSDYLVNAEIFEDLPVINIAGKLSVQETAQFLRKAKCIISVNTGIMHLAGALNLPTFCLHGPTNPNRWGAVGKNVYSFSPLQSGHFCLHLGYEKICPKCRCMDQILPEKVFAKIKPVLSL